MLTVTVTDPYGATASASRTMAVTSMVLQGDDLAVGGDDEYRAGAGQDPQRRGDRGHPGSEHQRARGALQLGQCRFQLAPGRIRIAAVEVQFGILLGCQMEGGGRDHAG